MFWANKIWAIVMHRINTDNKELQTHNSTEDFCWWHKREMWNSSGLWYSLMEPGKGINSSSRLITTNSCDFLLLLNTWTSPKLSLSASSYLMTVPHSPPPPLFFFYKGGNRTVILFVFSVQTTANWELSYTWNVFNVFLNIWSMIASQSV